MIFYIVLCLVVIILAIVIWGGVTKWKFIKRKDPITYPEEGSLVAGYDEGKQAVYDHVFSDAIDTSITKNKLGDSAGVFGAALLGEIG